MKEIRIIAIFYFSGTGNSKKIASWLCEFAIQRGIGCQLSDISKIDHSVFDTIEPNTLIGITYKIQHLLLK
jgi:flavodoxin